MRRSFGPTLRFETLLATTTATTPMPLPLCRRPDSGSRGRVASFNQLALANPAAAAPGSELDRRQLRATYYGAQREVDDRLGELFGYLERTGLAGDTLVVLTSDHGEMGCDHWLVEKLGLLGRELLRTAHRPRPTIGGRRRTRGSVVDEFTESVDVLPTLCDWMGVDAPIQVDGMSLRPFVHGEPTPQWRTEAHFEWDFSMPASAQDRRPWGLPLSHSWLGRRPGTHAQVRPVRGGVELAAHRCCSTSSRDPVPTREPGRGPDPGR